MGGPLYSVLDLVRNYHQCLIAEIHYEDDPNNFGDTPGSSDNLSQRNLILEMSANPGEEASRRVASTMWVRPSPIPKHTGSPLSGSQTVAGAGRLRHDELVIWWKNLPEGASIDLYIPSIDVSEIMRLAGLRAGGPTLEKIDKHTLRMAHRNITYIPLPGGLKKLIPCLLSVQLPAGVTAGQEFRVVIHQYSGVARNVIGAVEMRIPVRHKAEILPFEERKLAVLKYIKTKIPQSDRWFPVFERYVKTNEDRVRGLGGNPDAIEPSNHVTTRPGTSEPEPDIGLKIIKGKITGLSYDCFGDFEGFTLETCDDRRFIKSCERGVEEVARQACSERSKVTVHVEVVGGRLRRMIVHCC